MQIPRQHVECSHSKWIESAGVTAASMLLLVQLACDGDEATHHAVVGYGLGVAALLVELSRLSVRVQC